MFRNTKFQNKLTMVPLLFCTQVQAGLPDLQIDGVDTAGTDPLKMAKEMGGAIFTFGLTLVVALFALSIIRNGWQKYHETGDDGSRTQLKEAAINMVVGSVLLVGAIVIGKWGLASFT